MEDYFQIQPNNRKEENSLWVSAGMVARDLNVSIEFVRKLIKEGKLLQDVGGYVSYESLKEYKEKRKEEREKALEELTKQSQELGLYD